MIEDGEESGLSIEGFGRRYLVEIKSTTGDSVKMTATQMKKAVEAREEFVVCFVKLPDTSPDREVVEAQSRFIFDIGAKVYGLWRELSNLRQKKEECVTYQKEGDLTLEIDDLGAKLKIGRESWELGKTLAEAEDFFSGGE